jgi:hypothetical protein
VRTTSVESGRAAGGASARSDAREAARCRRKFLRIFPGGFRDPTYVDWERDYKWLAHLRWREALGREVFAALVHRRDYATIVRHAISIESRTNLLFSFEKMALRDAVRPAEGARAFSRGLFDFLHGEAPLEARFAAWRDVVAALPRRQTRVLTWPVLTVFPFIAEPKVHLYLKPTVTRVAARAYGFDFDYRSRPDFETYASLLDFGRRIRADVRDLRPRDQIDIQSFIWVQGSDEYE